MLHACVERFDVMGGRENILGWDEEVNKALVRNPRYRTLWPVWMLKISIAGYFFHPIKSVIFYFWLLIWPFINIIYFIMSYFIIRDTLIIIYLFYYLYNIKQNKQYIKKSKN
jgi:hypothetical protein